MSSFRRSLGANPMSGRDVCVSCMKKSTTRRVTGSPVASKAETPFSRMRFSTRMVQVFWAPSEGEKRREAAAEEEEGGPIADASSEAAGADVRSSISSRRSWSLRFSICAWIRRIRSVGETEVQKCEIQNRA